jgi:AcrR family transcriptional regulator
MMRETMEKNSRRPTLSTPLEEDWIAAAREMLIEGGVAAVEINPVAARLGVTRGGFYWRFKNRQELLDHLLEDWRKTNTGSLLKAVAPPGTPEERMTRLVHLWIYEQDFNPALDAAVRDWARTDKAVEAKVRKTDTMRIKAISKIFLDAGQDPKEAMMRGRVIYYHQVGYFTLGVKESRTRRLELAPLYRKILTGDV